MPLVETHVDDFLRIKLPEAMPMISMFVGEKTILQMKTVFINELQLLFPQIMEKYASQLKKDLNPEK